jgi:bifunctional non-homologous end joining protein LigD
MAKAREEPADSLDGAKARGISGAAPATLPKFVAPELSTLAAAPPSGSAWAHEIKFDGYRILARVEQGEVTLFSRNGNDWTSRMPTLAEAMRAIPAQAALLDGELVVLDARGVSDFQSLQDALGGGRVRGRDRLVYYAFDLLYLNGVDVRGAGLAQRKALLGEVIAHAPPAFSDVVRLSEHVIGQGPAFFAQAARMGLEGIVSKKLDAPYRSGRGKSWLKVKCSRRQEFVVVGFTEPKGSRSHLGALLLATYSGVELVYRGRVGTGFSDEGLRELHAKLAPLRAGQPSLVHAPIGAEARDVHWVRPELVAEVSFAGFTQEGVIRHSTFAGLRDDKAASEVTLE